MCGYGPQENDKIDKKDKFWSRLSSEVEEAQTCEAGIILQIDGNLWTLVPGDPNPINNNGKMLKAFLVKFPHLTVVNSMDIYVKVSLPDKE